MIDIKDINELFEDAKKGKLNLKKFEDYQVRQEVKDLENEEV